MAVYYIEFPGRGVDILQMKYTSFHRKKLPTGDPNMPQEVCLAKKVKYMIGDWAQLGREDYDMVHNRFGGEDMGVENDNEMHVLPLTPPPPIRNIVINAGDSSST